MDAEVGERRQPMLIDRVPQAQLRGDPVLEPLEDGHAVAPLGRGRETQKLHRADLFQQGAIGGRGGVVELVHDDHIEVRWVDVRDSRGVQALDRREDVVEPRGPVAADPAFAEGVVAQAVTERGEALVEDLLAVRHEQ